jgi:hypothetical protein
MIARGLARCIVPLIITVAIVAALSARPVVVTFWTQLIIQLSAIGLCAAHAFIVDMTRSPS